MAITIEVTRGRYLRHLRDLKRQSIREITNAINAVLPDDQRVAHSWLHQLELDSGKSKMTVLRALALQQVLGADLVHLEVSADDMQAVLALVNGRPDDLPPRRGRPRGQPKRSSSCIVPDCSARPTTKLMLLPFAAGHCQGWDSAYR